MTARPLFLAVTSLLASLALADPAPESVGSPEPEDFDAAVQQQDAASRTLLEQSNSILDALRQKYSALLEALRAKVISEGNLDRLLAVDAERARMRADAEISPEEKAQLFYTLRDLRARYDRERAEQMRHISSEARAGLLRYAGALDRLSGLLAQRGNVYAAQEVQRARWAITGPPPTTAVASAETHVSAAASTSSPAPAVSHATTTSSAGSAPRIASVTHTAPAAPANGGRANGGTSGKTAGPAAPKPVATSLAANAASKTSAKSEAPKAVAHTASPSVGAKQGSKPVAAAPAKRAPAASGGSAPSGAGASSSAGVVGGVRGLTVR